jgi:hypothetical protein
MIVCIFVTYVQFLLSSFTMQMIYMKSITNMVSLCINTVVSKRLKVSENRVLSLTYGSMRQELTGGWNKFIMRS